MAAGVLAVGGGAFAEQAIAPADEPGEFDLADVYAGLDPAVPRGAIKYLRVVEEVQHRLDLQPDGEYRKDHEAFFDFYASPVDKVPASYGALITKGLVHYADCGLNSGGCEKLEPLTFGALKSRLWEVRLWEVLNKGYHDTRLSADETLRIKTWIDLNCPLWPDYVDRNLRQVLLTRDEAAGTLLPRYRSR